MDPSVWMGERSVDVAASTAASTAGLAISACVVVMAGAIWLIVTICDWLSRCAGPVCVPPAPDAAVSVPPASGTADAPSSDAPVAEPVLAVAGAGLPAGRLPRGEWTVPPAPGGMDSPWTGTLVASGRQVDTARLARLYAVIPREWMN